MGLFKKRADADDLERLRAEMAAMSARLDAATNADQQLGAEVRKITHRLDTPMTAPPSVPPPVGADTSAHAPERVDLGPIEHRLDQLAERVDQVDARITSISGELANQITELSGDLDALGADAPPAEQVVDELRDAQTRLAGEQARYQIAFRQDLADLAERLKRPPDNRVR